MIKTQNPFVVLKREKQIDQPSAKMSSTVTIVRPTVNTFPIKQLASRWCEPVLLLSIRSFLSNFDRIFFIFLLIHKLKFFNSNEIEVNSLKSPRMNQLQFEQKSN